MSLDLVKISEYGLEGKNRYWVNGDRYNVTQDELRAIGITDDQAYLNRRTCEKLQRINEELQEHGLQLIVKDAYRSKELYDLVYEKRVKMFGKEQTDKIFNVRTYPHATGDTVDVSLVNAQTKEQLPLVMNIEDRQALIESRATDFYANSTDEKEQVVHTNRMTLKNIMNKYGFEGIPHEYRHFNLVD